MIRKKAITTVLTIAALTIWSAIVFAHNGIEHVMGTVAAVGDTSITVDTVKHTTVTVIVNPATTFSHKDVKASIKDLKIGDRVVINAKEGADKKLTGVSVKWGSNAMPNAAHAEHAK